jgi:hypothetical protein
MNGTLRRASMLILRLVKRISIQIHTKPVIVCSINHTQKELQIAQIEARCATRKLAAKSDNPPQKIERNKN